MSNFDEHADLVVKAAAIWTGDREHPWAESFAVVDGVITEVGTAEETASRIGPQTTVVDAGARTVMPGLSEGHVHISLGGEQTVFELPLEPTDGVDVIVQKVRDWPFEGPDEWVVGGIIGATVIAELETAETLQLLDEAGRGRPILLRDDSLHNRWVSSRTLEIMGVDASTPDPPEGRYVRDSQGRHTGVLQESAAMAAESVFVRTIAGDEGRVLAGVRSGLETLTKAGFTSAQDAATMGPTYRELRNLEDSGELTMRVVASMPVRQFIQEGTVGDELISQVRARPGDLVRPDFVKVVMDGVPMTRTSAMLQPYRCDHGQEETSGHTYWTFDDLVVQVEACYDQNLGAKFHAGGNAAVRLVLDAVEHVRGQRGSGPQFQIAHTEFVHADDVPRFGALNVVADASPFVWFPSTIHDSISAQIPQPLIDESWPFRQLLDGGAVVTAGSDWPCAARDPEPWTGLQALVTRANPDRRVQGQINPSAALTLDEAVVAFTRAPAEAMGLGDVTGQLKVGYSADFIVLDRDLFGTAIEEIHTTQVRATYFRGTQVHAIEEAEAEGDR